MSEADDEHTYSIFGVLFGVYDERVPERLKRIVGIGETFSKILRRKLLAITS